MCWAPSISGAQRLPHLLRQPDPRARRAPGGRARHLGSYQHLQRHTLGLVRLSSAIVENACSRPSRPRHPGVASTPGRTTWQPWEGIAAVTPDGRAGDQQATPPRSSASVAVDAVRRDFSIVFEQPVVAHRPPARPQRGQPDPCVNGKLIHVQLRGRCRHRRPTPAAPRRARPPVRPARRNDGRQRRAA